MKKFFPFIFGFLCFSSLFTQDQIQKPNILIFVIKGGGGHISAANSISQALKKKYNTNIENPFTDPKILGPLDFVKKFSLNSINCEDLYNVLLRNRWNWCINRLSDWGSYWILNHKKRLKKVIEAYLKEKMPDMIISVIPFLNGIILEVAQDLNIPFLIVPTDLNTQTFALGIKGPKKYKNFNFSLAFNDKLLLNKIKSFNLNKDNIKFLGYPLRKDFFETKDKAKIKEEFNVPNNKPVIMILMGAEGSNAVYSYVYHLIKNKIPKHLIVCNGRNVDLKNKVQKIKLPDYVTMTNLGFTDRISDLMSVSDLLITKPGSHSVCEAIQIGVPILIDQTIIALQWETLNGEFIKKYGIGDVVKNYRKINNLLNKFLTDKDFKDNLKKNSQKLKRESFEKPLNSLVEKMLQERSLALS